MIEITHAQAEHLIRAGQDGRRLPEEQWAALQAHLERCERCRAYRTRINHLEHHLGHLLHERWRVVEMCADSQYATPPLLVRHKRALAAWGRFGRRALPYALGFLALVAFIFWQQYESVQQARSAAALAAARANATQTPTHAVPTPSLTPGGGPFPGLLAFPEMVDGAPDIILLNPSASQGAGERTNLTDSPARDIYPTWSPDGEWIAFLSDRDFRDQGKFELYVISVAGTRLTRLTNRADIEWDGPLTWSADGKYIALTGWRDVAWMQGKHQPPGEAPHEGPHHDHAFIYMVPLDGSGPRSLALTAEAPGPLRFSPGMSLLAYRAPNGEGLTVYDYDPLHASYLPAAYNESAGQGLETGMAGSFDWSPDGRRLAFIASQPTVRAANTLKATLDVVTSSRSSENVTLYQAGPGQYITSVSWLPDRSRRVLAFLMEAGQQDCPTLHLLREGADARPRAIPELCVVGSLSPQQWTRDGQWLVLPAFERGRTAQVAIHFYAIRVPGDLGLRHDAPYQRLADAAPIHGFEQLSPAMVRPHLEPGEVPLAIDPHPVVLADPLPAPRPAPAHLPGRLVFSVVNGPYSTLHTLLPNGADGRTVSELYQTATCPTWSPDGQRLAFLSDRGSAIRGAMEVFVLDGAAGARPVEKAPQQLTDRLSSPSPLTDAYDCPVWSPDGTRLAVRKQTREGRALVLLALDGSPPVEFAFEDGSSINPPVWAPDGQSLLLVSHGGYGSDIPMRVTALDLSGERPRLRRLLERPELVDIFGIVFAPPALSGGTRARVAFVGLDAADGTPTLFTMRADGSDLKTLEALPRPTFNGTIGTPGLAWLPDGSLFYPIRHAAHERYKTSLWLVDPSGERRPLAYLEDLLIDSAWSADGRWLVYTSDAGLFLLDKEAALRGEAAPLLLSDLRVNELDWR